MKYSEVHAALRDIGNEIGHYHQSSRIKENRTLRGSVGKGMCTGAALDWIQMVLRGANGAAGPSDLGSMEAHLAQQSSARPQFYIARKKLLTTQVNQESKELQKDIQDLTDKLNATLDKVREKPGMTQGRYNEIDVLATNIYNQEVQEMKTNS